MDPLFDCFVKLFISHIHQTSQWGDIQGSFCIFGHPISHVETMGTVVSVDVWKDRKITIELDDGTGTIPCVLWMAQNNESSVSNASAAARILLDEQIRCCTLGASLHVFGRLHLYKNTKQMIIERIVPSADPNEESLFWVEVIDQLSCLRNRLLSQQTRNHEEDQEMPDTECLVRSQSGGPSRSAAPP